MILDLFGIWTSYWHECRRLYIAGSSLCHIHIRPKSDAIGRLLVFQSLLAWCSEAHWDQSVFFTLDVHSTHFLDVVCGIFSSHPYFCFHSSWSMVFTGSVSGTRNPSGSYTEFTTDTLWVCGLSFTMILNMNVSFSTPHCRPWLCLPPEKQRAQRGCYSPTLWGEILPCDRQLTGLTSYTASCSEGIDFRQSST